MDILHMSPWKMVRFHIFSDYELYLLQCGDIFSVVVEKDENIKESSAYLTLKDASNCYKLIKKQMMNKSYSQEVLNGNSGNL